MAEVGLIDTTEGFTQARMDAEHAIALNPDLAGGYLALATTQIKYDWGWDSAKTSIVKASDLEPRKRRGAAQPLLPGAIPRQSRSGHRAV